MVLGATWLTPMPPAERANGGTPEVWLVENTDWSTGLASSVQDGLAAVQADVDSDAVVVTLVDTPCVGSQHLNRIDSALPGGATAAVATYAGTARTAVGLTRPLWADVAATLRRG